MDDLRAALSLIEIIVIWSAYPLGVLIYRAGKADGREEERAKHVKEYEMVDLDGRVIGTATGKLEELRQMATALRNVSYREKTNA